MRYQFQQTHPLAVDGLCLVLCVSICGSLASYLLAQSQYDCERRAELVGDVCEELLPHLRCLHQHLVMPFAYHLHVLHGHYDGQQHHHDGQ